MIQNGYYAGGSNPEFLVGVTGADESRTAEADAELQFSITAT